MKEYLLALKELQSIDLKIHSYKTQITQIPKNIDEMKSDVDRIKSLLDKECARLDESITWRDERESQIAIHLDMLTKSKSKVQMSRNEKELKAAQREMDSLKKNIQDREEETINIMEAIEQYKNTIDNHTSEFKKLENELLLAKEEGEEKIQLARESIDKFNDSRSELTEKIPRDILSLYNRVQKRLGNAMVQTVDGHCSACHIDLPPQMYNELQRGDKLFTCPSCVRILFFEPAE